MEKTDSVHCLRVGHFSPPAAMYLFLQLFNFGHAYTESIKLVQLSQVCFLSGTFATATHRFRERRTHP